MPDIEAYEMLREAGFSQELAERIAEEAPELAEDFKALLDELVKGIIEYEESLGREVEEEWIRNGLRLIDEWPDLADLIVEFDDRYEVVRG